MAWFRLISAAFDSSVWPYTRPVPLSQVSPYTAEFFWRIMSDAEVARLRGLICSLRLFFGTFGSGIANQTWRDFGEKPEKQTLLSLHYSESSTIEAPSLLGFLLSIAAGRKSPFVFWQLASNMPRMKSNILSNTEVSQSVFHPSLQSFEIKLRWLMATNQWW